MGAQDDDFDGDFDGDFRSSGGATVRLTDLEVIQQFSLAVRGATASRQDVIAALQADLAYLTSGRSSARSVPSPSRASLPSAGRLAPISTAKPPAAKAPVAKAPAAKAPAKKAAPAQKGAAKSPAKSPAKTSAKKAPAKATRSRRA